MNDLRGEYDQLVLKAVSILADSDALATPLNIARYIHRTAGGGHLVDDALQRLEDSGLVEAEFTKALVAGTGSLFFRPVDALSQVAKAAADVPT